ncbi:MAG: DUF3783 domain-containing protein [Treponema sp.]|nr:DUF3783 domain-containing protein [Treponema sp.]
MEPVIFMHGFDNETIFKIVEGVKKAAQEAGLDPSSIAFASSTVNNMEWKIRKLIREVRKEHDYMARKAAIKPPTV